MREPAGMSKRSSSPMSGQGLRFAAALVALVLVAACAVEPERRIDDPACEYCYELASGVKYKTFEYYDP